MRYEEKQWYTPLMKTASTPVFYVVDAPIDLVSIAVVAPVIGILSVADKVSELTAQQAQQPES